MSPEPKSQFSRTSPSGQSAKVTLSQSTQLYKVSFIGGPWAGRVKHYPKAPWAVSCAIDARAAGMHGLYKIPREVLRNTSIKELTATWADLPFRN